VVFYVVTPCGKTDVGVSVERSVAVVLRISWRWRQPVPPKLCYLSTKLHCVTSRDIQINFWEILKFQILYHNIRVWNYI